MSAALLARIVGAESGAVHRRVGFWVRERAGETWAKVGGETPLVMRATEADIFILACQATRPEELSREQLLKVFDWLNTKLNETARAITALDPPKET